MYYSENVDSAGILNSNTNVLSAYKEDWNCTGKVKALGQCERQCSLYCLAELDSDEIFFFFSGDFWGEKILERLYDVFANVKCFMMSRRGKYTDSF